MGKPAQPSSARSGAFTSGIDHDHPAAIRDYRIQNAVRDLEQNDLPAVASGGLRARLSRDANLYAGRFGVLFKRETGLTLANYVKIIRLKRAAALLKTTALRVNEIAYAVGYTAPSNFDRDFAGTFGASPAEYRKRYARRDPSD